MKFVLLIGLLFSVSALANRPTHVNAELPVDAACRDRLLNETPTRALEMNLGKMVNQSAQMTELKRVVKAQTGSDRLSVLENTVRVWDLSYVRHYKIDYANVIHFEGHDEGNTKASVDLLLTEQDQSITRLRMVFNIFRFSSYANKTPSGNVQGCWLGFHGLSGWKIINADTSVQVIPEHYTSRMYSGFLF